jgi:iron complex outermembrane receptor protein
MTRSSIAKILLGSTALAATLVSIAPAWSEEIETVVVTARQRNENIQKVPAQVSAFTSEVIEAKGISNPAEFLNAVPNVTFITTQNSGTSFVVMRGIGQARNSEPSAAIVVDGVPLTQPAAFNQDLFDIQQIEVIKGPQGALYGRDAIGGAILINTKQPGDIWEGRFTAGYDNGPGGKGQAVISGPIAEHLRVRAAVSYWNTDGWLTNHDTKDQSAKRNADPVEDLNARVSVLFDPTENFTADLRLSTDLLNTRGLYYTIDFAPDHFNNPNYVDQPINLNNSGMDDRKIYDAALKLSYNTGGGTLSSITGYSTVWEILTGDGYSFDPFGQSKIGFDFGQAQFLTARTLTQELRYTSSATERFRWIAGGEIFYTQRYISTGNMWDGPTDSGVQPVYRDPNPQFGTVSFDPQAQISFLADAQNQFAWATYLDMSYDILDSLELSVNMRYDSDHRENTTLTPQEFLDANPVTGRQAIPAHTGDKRSHTWDAFQPQVILRWQATDNLNLYADYSRGFRSGGFNQTGVAQAAAAAGFDNVGDLFNANTADTVEAGFKSQWDDGRFVLNGSAYYTWDHNDYYFVFLASNSTQNLGNIKAAELAGIDLDMTAHIDEHFSVNAGFGYTHSEVTEFPGASSPLVVGSRVPLVSDYTLNVGMQFDHPIGPDWMFHSRLDWNRLGDTTFVIPVPAAGEPVPVARKPVDLVDLRLGIEHDNWLLTAWSKNLFDEKYNTEYSTGGFRFIGQPMSWGLELTKRF